MNTQVVSGPMLTLYNFFGTLGFSLVEFPFLVQSNLIFVPICGRSPAHNMSPRDISSTLAPFIESPTRAGELATVAGSSCICIDFIMTLEPDGKSVSSSYCFIMPDSTLPKTTVPAPFTSKQ